MPSQLLMTARDVQYLECSARPNALLELGRMDIAMARHPWTWFSVCLAKFVKRVNISRAVALGTKQAVYSASLADQSVMQVHSFLKGAMVSEQETCSALPVRQDVLLGGIFRESAMAQH
jgi:hypothetical protein